MIGTADRLSAPAELPRLVLHEFGLFEEARDKQSWQPLEPESLDLLTFLPFGTQETDAPGSVTRSGSVGGTDEIDHDDTVAPVNLVTGSIYKRHDEEIAQIHAREIKEIQTQHEREIEAIRQANVVQLARQLNEGIKAAEERLAKEIDETLARILTPLIFANARKSSVKAIISQLRRILVSGENSRIRVSGPLDLIEAIKVSTKEDSARLVFEEAQSTDVTIEVDSQIIATRLSEWQKLLQEILA